MAKQPTYRDFFKRFPDDETCLEHLKHTRYGDKHHCASCGAEARYYRVRKRRCYECEHCGYQVYPMAGTPFENTRTSLQDWFYVMHLFCSSRNGVSAKEVERQIGVTYKTAWRMCRLIRAYMTEIDGNDRLGGDGRIVEADETFIGGRDCKGKDDKIPVLGIVERDGDIATKVLTSRKYQSVAGSVADRVRADSIMSTDEGGAFSALPKYGFPHVRVNHSKGEYRRGKAHTNTIEGFWSLFKGAYHGTYVHVSPKYLPLYLGEFEFRWNLRKSPERMLETLLQGFQTLACRMP